MINSEYICGDCYYAPSSHSFRKIGEYYYCCPSSAKKYYDADGIEHHICLELSKVKRPWTLILDMQGYRLKHAPCINIIIKLSHTFYFEKLQQIIIINHNLLFKLKINTSWFNISKSIRNKILFDTNNTFSKLFNITNELYNDEYAYMSEGVII